MNSVEISYRKGKKGIIFLKNLPSDISFREINVILGKFGTINKSFFFYNNLSEKNKYITVSGFFQYSNKINAKKIECLLDNSLLKKSNVAIFYLKSFDWEEISEKLSI